MCLRVDTSNNTITIKKGCSGTCKNPNCKSKSISVEALKDNPVKIKPSVVKDVQK